MNRTRSRVGAWGGNDLTVVVVTIVMCEKCVELCVVVLLVSYMN